MVATVPTHVPKFGLPDRFSVACGSIVIVVFWFVRGAGWLGVVAGCTWVEQLKLAVLLGNGQLVPAIAGVVRAAAPYLGLALLVASILPLCVALLCVLYALLGLLCSVYLIK